MPRLPGRESYNTEPDLVRSYISDRKEIKRQVAERQAAAKLEVKRLNQLRSRYVKERGLFPPGVEFALKLHEEFKPRSALEWLRGFDVAREVIELDKQLGQQEDLVDRLEQEEVRNDLATAVA